MLQVTLPAAFAGGFISFLSPCVLPLVPPYLSYLAGLSLDEMAASDDHGVRRRALVSAILFVAGFSTVFTLLGATASVLGQVVRQHLDILGVLAGLTIIAMGLHFLGVFRMALLYREKRVSVARAAGPGTSYLMGLAFAFGWTPCIGPILAAILTVAGAEQSAARGALLLAVYSAGLGIPFLLAALLMGPFVGLLARMRSRLGLVEKVMGVALVATGVAFLGGWMSVFSFWLLETFPMLSRFG